MEQFLSGNQVLLQRLREAKAEATAAKSEAAAAKSEAAAAKSEAASARGEVGSARSTLATAQAVAAAATARATQVCLGGLNLISSNPKPVGSPGITVKKP
jgi:uncharacterized protein (DUF3084 family)